MSIHIKAANKGKLHSMMGIPQGQPIPTKKLMGAKKNASPLERKRIQFGLNARKWSK